MKTDRSIGARCRAQLALSGCALLCSLMTGCGEGPISVEVTHTPVMADFSPLFDIIEKASLEDFEKAVCEHPQWVNQKSSYTPDSENLSVLTTAAFMARTNHVRVLIRNGADVAEALGWCKRNHAPEGRRLISDVAKELGKEVVMP